MSNLSLEDANRARIALAALDAPIRPLRELASWTAAARWTLRYFVDLLAVLYLLPLLPGVTFLGGIDTAICLALALQLPGLLSPFFVRPLMRKNINLALEGQSGKSSLMSVLIVSIGYLLTMLDIVIMTVWPDALALAGIWAGILSFFMMVVLTVASYYLQEKLFTLQAAEASNN